MDFYPQYISDIEDGEPTHIIIPIKEWYKIERTYDQYKNYLVPVDDRYYEYYPLYLLPHYADINKLLAKMDSYSKEDWLSLYKTYFKYYDSLSQEDIALLYFFRSYNLFYLKGNSNYDEVLPKHLTTLFYVYGLKSSGKVLTIEAYENLSKATVRLNEIAFLQYFNMHFTIDKLNVSNKRLIKKTERDRLFIYDIFNYISIEDSIRYMLQEFNDFGDIIELNKKETIKKLATMLYNGNTSQIYRANQEAEDKIKMTNNIKFKPIIL